MKLRLLLPLFLLACGQGVEAITPVEPVEPVEPEPARLEVLYAQPTPLAMVPLKSGTVTRVLRDQTTRIALTLNTETVFCSGLGYSAAFLKVSVPDLDWLAHFDHRANAAGLPCAAAGPCSDLVTPDSILGKNATLSVVPVRVVLTEHLVIDDAAHTCMRQLVEKVTVQLADRVLRHSAEDAPVAHPYESCVAVAGL